MEYISKIREISKVNKYTEWYCLIISNAVIRASTRKEAKVLLGYVEAHHIVPKSFHIGGEKDHKNLVYLSIREHFICHRLLPKMLDGEHKMKMLYALFMMVDKIDSNVHPYKLPSNTYSKIKKLRNTIPAHNKGIPMSAEQKVKLRGIPKSEDTKKKISIAKTGKKVHTAESKRKLSISNSGDKNSFYGKKHTLETKERMSISRKGVKKAPRSESHKAALSKANKGKKMGKKQKEKLIVHSFKGGEEHPFFGGLPEYMKTTCIHCNRIISKGMHTRFHGDKCKVK